jgi:SAM-dependent methyltransferase
MAWLRWDLVSDALDGAQGPVLEIGCGQGAMGVRLARRFAYTGIEPDSSSAALARMRIEDVPGAAFHERTLDEPGTGDHGVVCAFEVLEHLEDDLAALRLWRTHLRPGGRLILSVPAWQKRFGATDEHVGHYRRYDPDVLAARLDRAGFDLVALRVYGWPLGYVLEWVRDRLTERRPPRAASATMDERSRGSGRFLQPREWMAWLPWLATLPFRILQRPFSRSSYGTGIVVVATRPE